MINKLQHIDDFFFIIFFLCYCQAADGGGTIAVTGWSGGGAAAATIGWCRGGSGAAAIVVKLEMHRTLVTFLLLIAAVVPFLQRRNTYGLRGEYFL